MNTELVLNELSLNPVAENRTDAKTRMSLLLKVIKEAIQYGAARSLRVSRLHADPLLCENYLLSQWRNDRTADDVETKFFKTLLLKHSYFEDGSEPLIESPPEDAEVIIHGQRALGLQAAHYLEGLAISLSSHAFWDGPTLEAELNYIDDADVYSKVIDIPHASSLTHVTHHAEWLKSRRLAKALNPAELWARRQEFFPNLSFCATVEKQIKDFDEGNPSISAVHKRLIELNEYCEQWRAAQSTFNAAYLPSKTTPESQKTLSTYGHLRTFLCPDGQNRLFSWHCRFTPGAKRIYFFPHSEHHLITIGYVGPKLPTVSDPT